MRNLPLARGGCRGRQPDRITRGGGHGGTHAATAGGVVAAASALAVHHAATIGHHARWLARAGHRHPTTQPAASDGGRSGPRRAGHPEARAREAVALASASAELRHQGCPEADAGCSPDHARREPAQSATGSGIAGHSAATDVGDRAAACASRASASHVGNCANRPIRAIEWAVADGAAGRPSVAAPAAGDGDRAAAGRGAASAGSDTAARDARCPRHGAAPSRRRPGGPRRRCLVAPAELRTVASRGDDVDACLDRHRYRPRRGNSRAASAEPLGQHRPSPIA